MRKKNLNRKENFLVIKEQKLLTYKCYKTRSNKTVLADIKQYEKKSIAGNKILVIKK